jgi:hypothetical protein
MKKITEYLIEQVVDLKIDLHKFRNENAQLKKDYQISEKVNGNLRNEISTLRLILTNPDEYQENTENI